VNGVIESKPVYDWDRTKAEELKRKTPFPPPISTTMAFPDFCEYYNRLREMPISDYARLYVQRWWPVLLPVEKQDQFGNIKESFPSDVKVSVNDGPMSEQLILQLAGVGQYKFRLNDNRRPWTQQTVVFSEVEISDRSLWNLNRAVFDLDRLDLDANRNQAYITFARSVGILPKEDEVEKEKAEMAQATVVESVMNDARQERARADQLQREALQRAEREAQQAKDNEAKAKAEVAAKVSEEPKVAAPASDLLNVVNSVATLAKSLQPAKDDSLTKYLEVQAQREQTQRERDKEERDAAREAAKAERLRADNLQTEMITELKKKAEPPPATAAVTPPTRRQMLEDAVAEQQLLKQLAGRGTAHEEEKPDKIDKWLEAAPIVGPIVQSIVGGIFQTFQFGFQTWQTISYNNAVAHTQAAPKPPTNMEKPPEPGKPIAPQGPPPTPEQIAQHQRLMFMLAKLEDAAEPIGNAIDDGDSGAVFAESIIKFKRRPAYDMIRALGEKTQGVYDFEVFKANLSTLMQHPNRGPQTAKLWEKVGPLPTFGQFLQEFFDYDEIRAKAEEEAEAYET
jgi:hypothetical protein